MTSQFIDKSCIVLQQNGSFTKRHTAPSLGYCQYIDKSNYSLIKYNLSSVISLLISTIFQKDI